ncbi:hypothetical protein MMC07_001234 [Pseudocyphellaria aurata]|nr:hypothetical protein [Pseudocyphellaria aurata]
MKDPLKSFTIAATGTFGPQRSYEKIRQWVEANGGTFTMTISPKVTHLICSREHFKKGVAMGMISSTPSDPDSDILTTELVQEARKIDGLYIVNFDWLEDTLMKKYRRKETKYLLQQQVRAAAKAKRVKKAVRKDRIQKGVEAFEKGCEDFQKEMFSNGYHIYRDSTTFAYDVTLARANLVSNQIERYHLKLYESHTEPSLYAAYVKSSSPGTPIVKDILAPIGSSFETALFAFTTFFALKTMRPWADRLAPLQDVGGDCEEEEEGVEKAFVYTPPKEDEPRGVILESFTS